MLFIFIISERTPVIRVMRCTACTAALAIRFHIQTACAPWDSWDRSAKTLVRTELFIDL